VSGSRSGSGGWRMAAAEWEKGRRWMKVLMSMWRGRYIVNKKGFWVLGVKS
jgi:hypothetical protein